MYPPTPSPLRNSIVGILVMGITAADKAPPTPTRNSGNYTVTAYFTDSFNICSDIDTLSISVVVTGGPSCNAAFNISGNTPSFTFTPSGNPSAPPGMYTYDWNFGDGNLAWGNNNPTHTYAANGTYNVTCIASDSISSCADTVTQTVIVTGIVSPTSGSISGFVNMGGNYADYGVVFLISNDSSGSLNLIDTTIIDSMGMYFFGNVAYGNYLVKAALSPASANFTNYLPTYHAHTPSGSNGALLWSDAADVILNVPFLNSIDIDLIAGINPGGAGFIGGLVSQGANKTGDPISDINIMVYNQNGEPVAYTYSDNQGTFQISNLPFGTYTIYPEVEGRITTPVTSTLTAAHPGEDGVRITVNSATVEVGITTSVEKLPEFGNIKLYPNPVHEELTIEINDLVEGNAIFTVTDLSGKTIQTFTANSTNILRINTSNWSEGMYFLTIEKDGQRANFKIVK